MNKKSTEDAYLFDPLQITSIFYKQRTKNYLVYVEIKISNNKKKYIRKGTFKTEEETIELVNKLKSLYKPI